MRYVVETRFTYGFENCWTDENGQPETFATFEEAQAALKDHLEDLVEAFAEGHLEDPAHASDFQITGIA